MKKLLFILLLLVLVVCGMASAYTKTVYKYGFEDLNEYTQNYSTLAWTRNATLARSGSWSAYYNYTSARNLTQMAAVNTTGYDFCQIETWMYRNATADAGAGGSAAGLNAFSQFTPAMGSVMGFGLSWVMWGKLR